LLATRQTARHTCPLNFHLLTILLFEGNNKAASAEWRNLGSTVY